MPAPPAPEKFPGDGLLHPLALTALAGLLLNDHVLKSLAAGTPWAVVTGKLSDVCGLLFLPVLVVAASEMVNARRARHAGTAFNSAAVTTAVVVGGSIALAFALMKTVPWCAERYLDVMSVLQWPWYAVRSWLDGAALPGLRRSVCVVDPTDLVALPFAFFVVLPARTRCSNRREG